MKNIVLISGLIRNEEIFIESLKTYFQLRDTKLIDDIIVSTDKHLLKEKINTPVGNVLNERLQHFLISNHVKIIETENLSIEQVKQIDPIIEKRPRNKLRKNTLTGLSLWRPMYGLKKALEQIEKDSYILKTRPDVAISPALVKKIFSEYKIKLEGDKLLEYKIWSTGFNEKELLYIMDFSFAGKREDLMKTAHMNGIFLKWGKNSPSGVNNFNTLWWIDIFYKKYPIIKQYYETYVNNSSTIQTYDEDLYKECMKLYYYIIDNYFIIDSALNDFVIKQSWGKLDVFNAHDGINIPKNGRTEFKNSNWVKTKLINIY